MPSLNVNQRAVFEHVAGCPGSGHITRVIERVELLRKSHGPSANVVVVTCASATVACLGASLEEQATIVLHDEVSVTVKPAVDAQTHLLLHDAHRISAGVLRTLLIRLRPATVFSVGATPFPHPDVAAELGWGVEQRLITHSFRVPGGHLRLINALLSAQEQTNVLIKSSQAELHLITPTVYAAEHYSHMKRAMACQVNELVAAGAERGSIVVISPSAAEARTYSAQLNSAGIPALAQDDARHLKDLTRVLWLADGVAKQGKKASSIWKPEDCAKMAVLLGDEPWKRLKADCLKLKAKHTGFDLVFKECSRLYLRARGGSNARQNQDLRAFLGSWEPLCLGDEATPRELRNTVREISSIKPVRCLTPHATRGSEWKHVVIGGLDSGVWLRRGDYHGRWGAEALELMLLACTRASDSLTIFVSDPDVPLGVIEGLIGKLPDGAVRVEWLDAQDV